MERLFTLAQSVAPLLTGEWRYNRLAEERRDYAHGNRAVISDDTKPGRRIVLRPCWRVAHRIEVYGELPSDRSSQTKITVSPKRSARAVASDINRRLLPDFLKEWEQAEAYHEKRTAELERYRHQVDLLKRFVPDFRLLHGGQDLRGDDEFSVPHGTLRMYAGDYQATLKLSLPFEDLVKVLMLLYGPGKTGTVE